MAPSGYLQNTFSMPWCKIAMCVLPHFVRGAMPRANCRPSLDVNCSFVGPTRVMARIEGLRAIGCVASYDRRDCTDSRPSAVCRQWFYASLCIDYGWPSQLSTHLFPSSLPLQIALVYLVDISNRNSVFANTLHIV